MKLLNNNFTLIKYNIFLNINIYKNFNGYNLIILNINDKTNIIEFNIYKLDITKITLNNIIINNYIYDEYNQICSIKFDKFLNIGKYYLKIEFNGMFFNDNGLIKYHDKISNRTFIYTRFEPIYARKCYPCFDEPKYKVKYNMIIQINDPNYLVLFNTDPIKIENNIKYYFKKTISMSSYLSSFIIAKYYYIEKYSKHNIRFRVYIPSDIKANEEVGKFALENGIKITDFITDYLKISYPYNKIDFIPINNTNALGMENYGLIFYNLDYLLYNEKLNSLEIQQKILLLIAHEISHQWFGNLVSIKHWNDLWLKESFAKFFEYFILDNLYPKYNIKSLFITKLFNVYNIDYLKFRSIKNNIDNIYNINSIYDDITYFKGANLLYMLYYYYGNNLFQTKINLYLNEYKFKSVDTTDFINIFTNNSNDIYI